jgi:hypothetical protein
MVMKTIKVDKEEYNNLKEEYTKLYTLKTALSYLFYVWEKYFKEEE